MGTEEQPSTKKPKDEESKMKFGWKPKPILADEVTQQPTLEKSFIGILKDKRSISKAIAGLANCLPSPQHLKRCSGLRIYLAPVDKVNDSPDELKKLLSQKGFDLSLLEDDFEIVQVSAAAPKTKSQMTYASKFWPVNFHPDLNLEALISGTIFDDVQLVSLESCMRLAILVGKNSAVGTYECNGSALILDPEAGTILTMAASSLDRHPMWHASMLAIDLVAKFQGGGTWKLLDRHDNQVDELKRQHRGVTPLCYPDSLVSIEVPKDGSLTFARKEQKMNKVVRKELDEKCGPYLCTGYWAILLQEPCPLCAMALLHSRVSRIFYGAANTRTGILGSRASLHSVSGLNHRYQVWSGVLEDECTKALEECRKIDR